MNSQRFNPGIAMSSRRKMRASHFTHQIREVTVPVSGTLTLPATLEIGAGSTIG